MLFAKFPIQRSAISENSFSSKEKFNYHRILIIVGSRITTKVYMFVVKRLLANGNFELTRI